MGVAFQQNISGTDILLFMDVNESRTGVYQQSENGATIAFQDSASCTWTRKHELCAPLHLEVVLKNSPQAQSWSIGGPGCRCRGSCSGGGHGSAYERSDFAVAHWMCLDTSTISGQCILFENS